MKKKRAPWPRWAKVLRNILLTALLGFLMWDAWGHPAFSYMADLRRTERQWLIPETEDVANVPRGIWDADIRIGWTEGAAVASYPVSGRFFTNAMAASYQLSDGPNLIALPWSVTILDGPGHMVSYACYAALQPPENSVSAVLSLHNEKGTYTVTSRREGDVFLFYDTPKPDQNGVISMGPAWFDKLPYELIFYDESGNIVGEISR